MKSFKRQTKNLMEQKTKNCLDRVLEEGYLLAASSSFCFLAFLDLSISFNRLEVSVDFVFLVDAELPEELRSWVFVPVIDGGFGACSKLTVEAWGATGLICIELVRCGTRD